MLAEGIESEPLTLNFHTLLAPPQNLQIGSNVSYDYIIIFPIDHISNEEVVITWAESSSSINNYRLKYYEKTSNSLSPESIINVNERFISVRVFKSPTLSNRL